MLFKVFTHILRNVSIKRNRDVILPNYFNQLSVCIPLEKEVGLNKFFVPINIVNFDFSP